MTSIPHLTPQNTSLTIQQPSQHQPQPAHPTSASPPPHSQPQPVSTSLYPRDSHPTPRTSLAGYIHYTRHTRRTRRRPRSTARSCCRGSCGVDLRFGAVSAGPRRLRGWVVGEGRVWYLLMREKRKVSQRGGSNHSRDRGHSSQPEHPSRPAHP